MPTGTESVEVKPRSMTGPPPPGPAPPPAAGQPEAPSLPELAVTQFDKGREQSERLFNDVLKPALDRHAELYEDALKALRAPLGGVEAVGKAATAAGEAARAVPTFQAPPPVPKITPRPFLDARSQGALGGVLQGLTLIAAMSAGLAAGAPVAALRAFTGALDGWKAGDEARAEREWREFLANSDRIRQENDLALKRWQAAMTASRGNLQAAQATLAADLAQRGLTTQALQVSQQGVDNAVKLWYMQQAIHTQELDLLKFLNTEYWRQRTQARLDASAKGLSEHRKFTEKQMAKRTEIAESMAMVAKPVRDAQGQLVTAITNEQWVPRILAAVERLAAKGILPEGPGVGARAFAALSRELRLRDPEAANDLAMIHAQLAPLVAATDVLRGEPASVMRLKAVMEPQVSTSAWPREFYWRLLTGHGAPPQRITTEAEVGRLLRDPALARRLRTADVNPEALRALLAQPGPRGERATMEDWQSLLSEGGLYGLIVGRKRLAAELLQRMPPWMLTPMMQGLSQESLTPSGEVGTDLETLMQLAK